MATTPRKTQTPGAKKETTTTAQTSTDDVMDAVLGKSKESDVVEDTQPVDPVQTQQSAEDVLADILSGEDLGQEEAPEGFISLEQFDAVATELAETKEQLAFLKQTQTSSIQGYLFSKPVAAGDFAQLLAENKTLDLI